MATLGIDVSVWQRATPSLAGLSFLIARASIGTTTDRLYSMHIAAARKASLIVGAYHFAYKEASMASQVKVFLEAAGDVDFYFIDVEGAHAPSRGQTAEFISLMHKAGKRCGLYHSDSGYFEAGQDYDWVARWTPEPPARKWDFWQYRGSPLDLDRFNGTPAQLAQLAGKEPAPPPTATEVSPMSFVLYDSPRRGKFKAGTDFYSDRGLTVRLGALSADAELEVLGMRGGCYAVKVKTGTDYEDKVARPTCVFVDDNALVGELVVLAPPAPPVDGSPFTQADIDAAVAAAVAPFKADLADAEATLSDTLTALGKVQEDFEAADAELELWHSYKTLSQKLGL